MKFLLVYYTSDLKFLQKIQQKEVVTNKSIFFEKYIDCISFCVQQAIICSPSIHFALNKFLQGSVFAETKVVFEYLNGEAYRALERFKAKLRKSLTSWGKVHGQVVGMRTSIALRQDAARISGKQTNSACRCCQIHYRCRCSWFMPGSIC